jgi:hypothetical protein
MKTLVKAVLTFSLLIFLLNGLNAITYEWKGTIDNNWNNPGNWLRGNGTPVPGPPTAGDDIIIDGTFPFGMMTNAIPVLSADVTVNSLTINNAVSASGGLNLGGRTLMASSLTISAGTINNGDLDISGSANITGGLYLSVDISAGTWTDLTNTIFLGATTIEKTGTSNDGNAIYNNNFGGDFTFNHTSGAGGNIRFGIPTANVYIGNVEFNNNVSGGSSLVTISEASVSTFSGNLTVNNGSTGGVEIGNSAGGNISVVDFTFSSDAGPTIIRNIVESGGGPDVDITNGTTLTISDCDFSGNVTADVSGFCEITNTDFKGTGPHSVSGGEIDQVNSCLFGGDVEFENGMAGDCPWDGGNTFQGSATFIKTAANNRNWRLDASTKNTYSGDVSIEDLGTGFFKFAEQEFELSNAVLTLSSPTGKDAGGVITLTDVSTLAGSGEWEATSMSINSPSGINMGPSFFITGGGGFSLTGIATMTSGGGITLATNSPFIGGSSTAFINGGFVKKLGNTAINSSTPFTFHVGDEGFYAPFFYSTSNNGNQPQVTVQYSRPGPGPDSPPSPLEVVSSTEQWSLTVENREINNTEITLPYGVQSGLIGAESDLRVAFNPGGGWTNLGGSAGGGAITGNANNFPAGSTYIVTLASIDAAQTPLPVELIYFKAEVEQSAVQLRWATASELNNDYFQIERSADGVQFDPIGAPIEGAGTTTEPLNYEYTDRNPLSGVSYYRLKQVDFGGQTSYSEVAPVRVGGVANNELLIYPNPVQGQLQVIWGGEQTIERIRLLDAKGQELSVDAVIDNKQAKVELQALTPGVYFLELLSGQERKIERIVIQ